MWDHEDSEPGAVIRRSFVPASDESTGDRRFALSGLKAIWARIVGHTAEDVSRLKEAGVSIAEGEARMRHAEAAAKEAEAAKLFQEAEAQKISNAERRQNIAREDAIERYAQIEAALRMLGGSVAFDATQIQRLIDSHPESSRESSAPSRSAEDETGV